MMATISIHGMRQIHPQIEIILEEENKEQEKMLEEQEKLRLQQEAEKEAQRIEKLKAQEAKEALRAEKLKAQEMKKSSGELKRECQQFHKGLIESILEKFRDKVFVKKIDGHLAILMQKTKDSQIFVYKHGPKTNNKQFLIQFVLS